MLEYVLTEADAGQMSKEKNGHVKREHAFLAITISGYTAAIDAAINYEVNDKRFRHHDTKVYRFDSRLEIEGVCVYPESRQGEEYFISVHGSEREAGQFNLTLTGCHVRDEYGVKQYRKVRGEEVPVYDIPKEIGMLDRRPRNTAWNGWLWVPTHTISDMLALLPHVRPLYLGIYELKEKRTRWIRSVTLQTNNPAEE